MINRDDFNNIKHWIVLGFIFTIFAFVVIYFDPIVVVVKRLFSVFSPLFYAIGFSFVLNIISSRLEKLLKKAKTQSPFYQKIQRPLSIFIAVVFFLLIISLLFSFIIPQLVNSLVNLLSNLPNYIGSIQKYVNDFFSNFDIPLQIDILKTEFWLDAMPQVSDFITKNLIDVINRFLSFTGVFFNIVLGFMISFYFLIDKERFIRQGRKVIMALFSYKTGLRIIEISKEANRIYSKFLTGKTLEATFLGLMFYVILAVLQIPFALLISCMIAILSFVPVIGAIIAWIIGTLLILAIDPFKALIFFAFYQILQQLETTFVYPRIIGKSIELPGVWTLLAVFIGGGLFGFFGILLGVPTAALIYYLFVNFINKRLEDKNIKVTDSDVSQS